MSCPKQTTRSAIHRLRSVEVPGIVKKFGIISVSNA